MFTKIKLTNFRSFDNLEFDLTAKNGNPKHLAVVFGENGAGKSNLMSSFVFLQEIFATMDVRDFYEELLSKEAIYIDEKLEKRRKDLIKDGLRDIQAIINDYRMVGCEEPINLEFHFQINGNLGKYIISLDDSEIIYEKLEYLLNKRRGVYFECSRSEIILNNNLVKEKDLLNDIKASAKRFWGKHSIIAIILHEVTDKSKSYVFDNISDNFKCVLDLLTTVSCCLKTGSRRWNSLYSPIDVFESPSKGILKCEKEYELDLAESVLSDFFTSINSNINKVYYEREYNDKLIKYTLYFEKFISGQYRQIPFSKESTGNYQLLRIFSYIISSSLGGVVAIDEADSGIHDYLFQKILHKIVPHINGQLIMTTHNTMLMESDFSKNSTYILKEEFEKMVIKAISEHDKRIYTKNNIRNKYLNGEYGGLPKTSDINFKELIESIYNAIKPLEEI